MIGLDNRERLYQGRVRHAKIGWNPESGMNSGFMAL